MKNHFTFRFCLVEPVCRLFLVDADKTDSEISSASSMSRVMLLLLMIIIIMFQVMYMRLWLDMGERERNVLFNDALNTFYLRLYGVRHMVKDHSDSEKGNPLPPHRLLLSINSKGSFICTIPQTG